VAAGDFRDDLYARLNLWTFRLPGLADRREDIEPNLDYELDRYAEREGHVASFNKEARQRYLSFAASPEATWPGNFRDLAASVTRMATLSPKGRIDLECVEAEITRLRLLWSGQVGDAPSLVAELLGAEVAKELDLFDSVQLEETVRICRASRSLSEAGRMLFSASRARRNSSNDADRLRKYLARYGLDWARISAASLS
jgi:transcriptional regulatory protein RtcR